jgi:hypothetical protein
MALNSLIPKKSHLSVIGGLFRAVLNNPTAGKYDFTNYAPVAARYNVAVDLGLAMNPDYLYFFSQMSFSLSMGEGVFMSAIDAGTVPTLTVRDSSTMKNIFHAPFRLFRYFENAGVDSYHFNANRTARLIADFQAVLVQTADLVGVSDVYAQVTFAVYEIIDPSFIANYKIEAAKRFKPV